MPNRLSITFQQPYTSNSRSCESTTRTILVNIDPTTVPCSELDCVGCWRYYLSWYTLIMIDSSAWKISASVLWAIRITSSNTVSIDEDFGILRTSVHVRTHYINFKSIQRVWLYTNICYDFNLCIEAISTSENFLNIIPCISRIIIIILMIIIMIMIISTICIHI